jgi:hypothetical protein
VGGFKAKKVRRHELGNRSSGDGRVFGHAQQQEKAVHPLLQIIFKDLGQILRETVGHVIWQEREDKHISHTKKKCLKTSCSSFLRCKPES